jgi:hypothetical protein
MNDTDQIFAILLKEYDKLKSEQTQRIGFRDNLIYVTLGLFGTVISFVVSNPANYYALLVIPWVCIILGWTYVVNDEKISSIGKYIRHTLVNELKKHIGYQNMAINMHTIFGWEIAHRDDDSRVRRKLQQLLIDEITFVFSGAISLISFWCLVIKPPLGIAILSWVEMSLLIGLGIEIFIYADLKKGR